MAKMGRPLIQGFLPPPFAESLSPDRVATIRLSHLLVIAFSLSFDSVVPWLLADSSVVKPEVLVLFRNLAIAPLLVAGVIAWFGLRSLHRAFAALNIAVLMVEMSIGLAWLQMTGLVSSYFVAVVLFFVVLSRVVFDYRTCAYVAALLVTGHLGLFALEELEVLPSASLIAAGPGEFYQNTVVRIGVMASIVIAYIIAFAGTNAVLIGHRLTERKLTRATKALARVAAGERRGRLTGSILLGAIADGDYELSDVLGRGGMAEIYRAEQASNHRQVAIKVLHPHLAADDSHVERFRREYEISRIIPHGIAPAVYDGTLDGDDELFIVMEYLQGEDLAASLRRRGRLRATETVDLVAEVAAVLDSLHDAHIVHRDLKPHNLFIEQASRSEATTRVRVLDFGISKADADFAAMTATVAVMGSPGFMAPEQAAGTSGDVGPAADVFALGAITYEALTSRRPFPAREAVKAMYQVLHECHEPASKHRPSLSPEVDRVLDRALAKKPTDRYHRAGEFAADLREALQLCELDIADATVDSSAGVAPTLEC